MDQVRFIAAVLWASGRVDGMTEPTVQALAIAIAIKKAPLGYADVTVVYETDLDEATDELLKNLTKLDEARFVAKMSPDDEHVWFGRA